MFCATNGLYIECSPCFSVEQVIHMTHVVEDSTYNDRNVTDE
ncbi:hypothetical protein [Methanobrevibacter sp.]